MKSPRVLVGCPTSDYHSYCIEDFSKRIKDLSYQNHDILLVDNSKTEDYYKKLKNLGFNVIKDEYRVKARDRVVSSRNILRNYALDNNCGYFLSLEQDVLPPNNIIEALLSTNKSIVAGVYFHLFRGQYVPIGSKVMSKDLFEELKSSNRVFIEKLNQKKISSYTDVGIQITPEEVETPKLIEVHEAGLGCVLISKEVLKKIIFRYDPSLEGIDDTWFYHDAREAGFKAFLDTSVKCKHLFLNRPWRWTDLE